MNSNMAVRSAIKGNLVQYEFNNKENHCQDVLTCLTEKKLEIIPQLMKDLDKFRGLKWYIIVMVKFVKTVDGKEITATPYFHGKMRMILHQSDDIQGQYAEATAKISESMARYSQDGSGWISHSLLHLDLYTVKYHPLYASSYIPTPKKISNSQMSIVNIKNDDQKCFLWSVIAALHPDPNRHHKMSYLRRFEDRINMMGIECPVKISSVGNFEQINPSISVNVFGYENKEIYPLRITNERRESHINLLLLTNGEGETHYCLIRHLSKCLAHLTKHEHAVFYCDYCLHRFSSRKGLDEHLPICVPHGAQKTKLPKEGENYLNFKNYTHSHRVPFTIYCDFESFVTPILSCQPSDDDSSTNNVAKHIPSGFCYLIVDYDGLAVKPPVVYSGDDVVDTFLDRLMKEAEELMPKIKTIVPMTMTEEDKINYESATACHLCEKLLEGDKVANHNHLNGKFLGAAHESCNLNYKVPSHIPVFFHNLGDYDCHHLMQGFSKFESQRKSCIAKTSERYISVTLKHLRFLDSLQFLNAKLDSLVANLATEGDSKFKLLRQCMGMDNVDQLLRKGVYPYSYMTDVSKFSETQLPAQEHFYNDLTETAISDGDYAYAQQIWDTFKMESMRDYHDFYLKLDVILLADVFENFRTTSLLYYQLDPCNMYSTPGLAWEAMLKMTKVKLELLTDIDQHLFIESGIRGGMAMIPNRYKKANNPYLPEYDDKLPTNYLIYLDCTNLYGTAMLSPLPISGFRWLNANEIEQTDFINVPDDYDNGYILEVDLEYPKNLHDSHSDYPLAPVRQNVTNEMLSPYCKNLQDELGFVQTKVSKLLTTLDDKEKYVLHYRNLKLYLKLGLVLKKIHRVLAFKQQAWMEPFIKFNTQKRKYAANSFEKDFFKLMNNAVYGKSIENVRGRIDFKLISNERNLLKWTASPRLKSISRYNDGLVGLTMKKITISLNKPIYAGFSILDISKVIMYTFHYEWAKMTYGSNLKLCMTDTDSLLYDIQTADVYADMKNNIELFDTSDYPTDHPCYHVENKKKLGTFKDEMNSKPIREFVGLRAKCYSVLDFDEKEKKVAKGVPRAAIRNQLKHELYKKCLFDHNVKYTRSLTIRSKHHDLYSQNISKLSLSPFDDKTYILANGTDTIPYGHYTINRSNQQEDNGECSAKRCRLE